MPGDHVDEIGAPAMPRPTLREIVMRDAGQPRATWQRFGRLTYTVIVNHGVIQWGPDGGHWFVHGFTPTHARTRAKRKARKVLAKYRLHTARNKEGGETR
jgi:hypothetical protein